MDDFARDLQSSRSHVSVEWSEVRSEVNREAVMRKLEKRAARRAGIIVAALAVGLAGLAAAAWYVLREPPPADATATAELPVPPTAGVPASDDAWRALVQQGEYDKAWAQLESGQGQIEDSAPALTDAADAAMRSGAPGRATEYLARVLADHADDPLAALAGFSLGRVQLDRLGQPREAAKSFARSYGLASERGNASLAEDALAAEVEAWATARDIGLAKLRAADYEARFPQGRLRDRVRRLAAFE